VKVVFPCRWPEGRERIDRNNMEAGRFSVSYTKAVADLKAEMGRFGAVDPVLTVNYAEQTDRPEVALWFDWGGSQRVIACDRYKFREGNVRAIGLTLEALRAIERWGTGSMMEQAMSGFDVAALPAASGAIVPVSRLWFEVLGVLPSAPLATCEAAYRVLAKALHPDAGGSDASMAELNRAIEEARAR